MCIKVCKRGLGYSDGVVSVVWCGVVWCGARDSNEAQLKRGEKYDPFGVGFFLSKSCSRYMNM